MRGVFNAIIGFLMAAMPLGGIPAHAQKSADTLRIAWRDAVTTLDPYYNQQRTGLILAHHLWDGLVHRDPETFSIKPLLAASWRNIDETTIEFELRRNVVFHDGSPFTADDVVYTLNLVSDPNSKVSTPANHNWIEKAEKTGDLSVRVKLKRPNPAANSSTELNFNKGRFTCSRIVISSTIVRQPSDKYSRNGLPADAWPAKY